MENRCVDILTLLEEYQIQSVEDIPNMDKNKQSLLYSRCSSEFDYSQDNQD